MSVRKSIVIGAALVLGMVLGGAISWQPSFAQQRAEQSAVGRFQATYAGNTEIGTGVFVVVHTATGQCWKRNAVSGQWVDVGTPVQVQK